MSPFEERTRARLREIDEAGLRRRLAPPAGIDLSSNDYLGLASDPRLIEAMRSAAAHEGVGSTGSRLLRGERDAFRELEEKFAAWKGSEASLYFSTGYAANLGVMSTFCEEGDVIFTDEKNHASLIDGMRLAKAQRVIFAHNDLAALESALESNEGRCRFVVVESLYSMDGDFAPLQEMVSLCREHEATLIVDESHACGIYGRSGSGMLEQMGVDAASVVSINTAGKALGVSGGFVCASRDAIELLVNRARSLIFSTAPPPSVAAAIAVALDVVQAEPNRRSELLRKSLMLRELLSRSALTILAGESQIIPAIVGGNSEAMRVATALQGEGFDVRAVRPPTVPAGTARLRISVNTKVSDDELGRLADAVRRLSL